MKEQLSNLSITRGQVLAAGGTLLASGALDVAKGGGVGGMLLGVGVALAVARHTPDVVNLLTIPGQNAGAVKEATTKAVQAVTHRGYQSWEEEVDPTKDQRPHAKIMRMFGFKTPPIAPPAQLQDEPMPDDDMEETLARVDDTSIPLPGIYADDPAFMLDLGPLFKPDVNVVLEEGIFCSGMKGSGKTSVLARVSEQIARYHESRQVVFDSEGDLQSLVTAWNNGRIVDAHHWYTAEEIITQRLQVVVNLQSWDRVEDRGQVIAILVEDLIKYTSAQRPRDRSQCPVFLDEAQYWLPEGKVGYLSTETQQRLTDAFSILLSTGRKRGLSPFLFTQRIAQIQKSAISCGVQIFMRQAIDNDQRRCAEYVSSKVMKKDEFAGLGKGQGVVCWPGGVQMIVQFTNRDTEHLSHTPTVAPQPTHILPEQRTSIPARPLVPVTERLPEREVVRLQPIAIPAPQAGRTFSQSELKRALLAYRAGHTSLRKLGDAIGKDKNYAASIKTELERRKLI